MTLNRQWIPSPNFSAGAPRSQLIVIHTSEGSTSQTGLAGFLANPSSGVSYHVCYDNAGDPNNIVECVRRTNRSWSAMNANSWGVHGCCCTPSGASAGWSRQTWLAQGVMLEKCRRWIAEEAAVLGIPLVKIDANAIRAGGRGVCGHGDCSAAGAGGSHFDPGNNFPWDIVLGTQGAEDLTPEESTLLRQIHESIPMLRDIQSRLRDGITGAGADTPNAFGSLQTLDWRIRDLYQRVEKMEQNLSK